MAMPWDPIGFMLRSSTAASCTGCKAGPPPRRASRSSAPKHADCGAVRLAPGSPQSRGAAVKTRARPRQQAFSGFRVYPKSPKYLNT
eukprot:3461117-Pyramimonas_sp.AAC.1